MGSLKWIVGFLGWVSGGPIGALLGFLVGTVMESGLDTLRQLTGGAPQGTAGPRPDWRQQAARARNYTATEQRNSFLMSLLVLSSAVIKADGNVRQSELDVVREFVRRNFGEAAVEDAMRILDGLNRQQVNIYEVGTQIATYMNYSQRLQLFHYLTQIAIADQDFSKTEKEVLEAIASAIRLNAADAASVIAMFYKDADSAYSVLEISPSATDDEVKSAYRRMAMKNHPDKVASLGPDVQKAAEEKFRQIQEAYETIKKQRGMR
ncbi:MAG: TerB family tellurite resistance protein [Bacteroidales bacterium]|nr:TerB family tellurite resistance protein [Bacteroidales bacterium]